MLVLESRNLWHKHVVPRFTVHVDAISPQLSSDSSYLLHRRLRRRRRRVSLPHLTIEVAATAASLNTC